MSSLWIFYFFLCLPTYIFEKYIRYSKTSYCERNTCTLFKRKGPNKSSRKSSLYKFIVVISCSFRWRMQGNGLKEQAVGIREIISSTSRVYWQFSVHSKPQFYIFPIYCWESFRFVLFGKLDHFFKIKWPYYSAFNF